MTAPVAPDTVTFVPATMDVTPELVTVGVVVPDTLMPVPAVSDCTPVADTLNVVVPLIEIPVPAAILAAIVGVTRQTVSRWENDKHDPSISQWRLIAQATGAWWMLRQPSGELPEPDESPFRTGRFWGLLQNCALPAGQMELPFALAPTLVAVEG